MRCSNEREWPSFPTSRSRRQDAQNTCHSRWLPTPRKSSDQAKDKRSRCSPRPRAAQRGRTPNPIIGLDPDFRAVGQLLCGAPLNTAGETMVTMASTDVPTRSNQHQLFFVDLRGNARYVIKGHASKFNSVAQRGEPLKILAGYRRRPLFSQPFSPVLSNRVFGGTKLRSLSALSWASRA
jgi:hypothetical protein